MSKTSSKVVKIAKGGMSHKKLRRITDTSQHVAYVFHYGTVEDANALFKDERVLDLKTLLQELLNIIGNYATHKDDRVAVTCMLNVLNEGQSLMEDRWVSVQDLRQHYELIKSSMQQLQSSIDNWLCAAFGGMDSTLDGEENPFDLSKQRVAKDLSIFRDKHRRKIPKIVKSEGSILLQCWPPLYSKKVRDLTSWHSKDYDNYLLLANQMILAINPNMYHMNIETIIDKYLHKKKLDYVQWAKPVCIEGLMYGWGINKQSFLAVQEYRPKLWMPF